MPEDLRLIDYLHEGFPLSGRPFAEVGAALGGAPRVRERGVDLVGRLDRDGDEEMCHAGIVGGAIRSAR